MIKINNDINEENLEDIEAIKKYFTKIFSVLSKDIRDRLLNLKVSIDKRDIIKKELAFLSEKKQVEYLDELDIIWNRILKDS